MKKLLAALVLALMLPFQAFAAIAFDTATVPACNNTTGSPAGTCTFSYTVTGSNTILVVSFDSLGSTSTGCTWNGSSMTQVGSTVALGGGANFYAYYILGASGTHNVVCTETSSAGFFYISAASYNGVSQTAPFEGTVTAGPTTATTYAQNITSTSDNDWGIWVVANTDSSITAGANTTVRTTGGANISSVADTGIIHPAGTVTLNASATGNTPWGSIAFAVVPAGAASPLIQQTQMIWWW